MKKEEKIKLIRNENEYENQEEPLSTKDKLAYGIADFGCKIIDTTVGFYLNAYTQILFFFFQI